MRSSAEGGVWPAVAIPREPSSQIGGAKKDKGEEQLCRGKALLHFYYTVPLRREWRENLSFYVTFRRSPGAVLNLKAVSGAKQDHMDTMQVTLSVRFQ